MRLCLKPVSIVFEYTRSDNENARSECIKTDKDAINRYIWTNLNKKLTQVCESSERITNDKWFHSHTKCSQYQPSKPPKCSIKVFKDGHVLKAYALQGQL